MPTPIPVHDLYWLRAAHRWSQRETARRLRISPGHYARLETGRCNPSLAVLRRLTHVFNVSQARLRAAEGETS